MFVQSEINEKKNRVRDLIRRLDLAGILLRKQCNFAWLTGGGRNLVGIATEVGVASILITPEREYVLCNNIEAPRMADEEKVEAMGYEIRSHPWHDDREAALVAELAGNGPVGCDDQFGGLRNVGGEVARLRWSLTPPEITRYKELGVTAAEALEAAAKSIRPGDTENAIIGRLANNLWERGCDYITVFCAADDRIARFRHPIATDRRIEKRAMLCCNARKSGLIVSFTRFVQFGKVQEELRRIYDANVYVDCVMMAHSVPGRPAVDAFKKGLEAYAECGFEKEYELHHQGGPIGYVGRDYKATFQTTETVRENQGFAWNPSITGSKSEDTMLATTDGPVMLTRPVTYPVLELEVEGFRFERPDIFEM